MLIECGVHKARLVKVPAGPSRGMKGKEKTGQNLIAYATDIHGNGSFIERALEKAAQHKVKAVVLNGDITPDEYFLDILGQRSFFEDYLTPLFKKFRKKHGTVEIFVLMGNHDYSVNMDVFYEAEKKGIFNALHERVHALGPYMIVGYSFINPAGTMDWEKPEPELRKDLERLRKRLDFARTVFVSHAPPYGTKLDVRYGRRHVGSTAIRDFIKAYQPHLALHGHIHESPKLTGSMTDTIGRTVCINPGNAQLVLVDLDARSVKKL
jgi:Icc-related predicted phosphoesterase